MHSKAPQQAWSNPQKDKTSGLNSLINREKSYPEVHVVGGTANAAITSHCVQREPIGPGTGGDAKLEL